MNIDSCRQGFVEEASEILTELESALLELEQSPDDGELVGRVFRAMHTVKGNCRMFGFGEMAGFIHELETVFDRVRAGWVPVDRELVDLTLSGVDQLRQMLNVSSPGQDDAARVREQLLSRLASIAFRDAVPPAKPAPADAPRTCTLTIDPYLGLLTEYEVSRLQANLRMNRRVYSFTRSFRFDTMERDLAQIVEAIRGGGELLSKIPRIEAGVADAITFELILAAAQETCAPDILAGAVLTEIDCTGVVLTQPAAPPRDPLPPATFRLRIQPGSRQGREHIESSGLFSTLYGLGPCRAFPCAGVPAGSGGAGFWDIVLTTDSSEEALRDIVARSGEATSLQIDRIDDGCADAASDDYKRLGEILVERGDVTQDALQRALVDRKRIGELLVEQGVVAPELVESALEEQRHVREIRQARVSRHADASMRVSAEKLDSLINLAGQLVTVQARLSQIASRARKVEGLKEVAEEVERLSADLRDNTLSIRMLPIGATFGTFTRMARDLAASLHKEAEIVISGGETELDKTVIERLNDPLVHLIRNCIDHGIELPEERERTGKPRRGTIHLGAVHSGDSVLVTIRDDGAGLDAAALRDKAVERGLIPGAGTLSDREIFRLVFTPGISTARTVTDLSGRGVGMDVVKRSIEQLRGTVDIDSRPGEGTVVTIRLPLTLAIVESLLVEIGATKFVMPLDLVEECVELGGGDAPHRRNVITVRDAMVPYIPLRDTFAVAGTPPRTQMVVVARTGDGLVGLAVDRVIGEHQAVIKSLGHLYRGVRGLSGATIMGDGGVALILDIPQLVDDARCTGA